MAKRSRRSTARSSRRRVSYKEPDSEVSSVEVSDDDEDDRRQPPRKRPALPTTPSRSKAAGETKRRKVPAMRLGQAKSRNRPTPQASKPQPIPSDGRIPPWASLPYEILSSVFRYASYPLWDSMWRPSSSIHWLLDTARVCKDFTEPALATLYESPPLVYTDTPHKLLDLLKNTVHAPFINYKTKIKRLELDAKRSLAYSAPGRGLFDLSDLIDHCPQLSEILIYDSNDRPPYRYVGRQAPWTYPDAIFKSLEEDLVRLKSWRWNGGLLGSDADRISRIHETAPFLTLRHLALSHIGLKSGVVVPKTATPNAPRSFVSKDTLLPLANLKSLSLESCLLFDSNILSNLPSALSRLAILNCTDLESKDLGEFLTTAGSTLEELVLNHNPGVDLSFLPDLRNSCPRLRHLEMDLTYYSALSLTRDAAAAYDTLMTEDDVPAWPSSLETLQMLHLRNWSVEAAEVFLSSLVGAAEHLPNLRVLVIKAILNIGWRDRAGFRDAWISRLRSVFLRKPTRPSPHLASSQAFRLWAKAHGRGAELGAASDNNPRKASTDSVDASARRSQRMRMPISYLKDESTKDAAPQSRANASSEREDPATTNDYAQGMCEVVDVSIDNMRPSEMRFNEDDFLDAEASGDEEWNERVGDLEPNREVYVYR